MTNQLLQLGQIFNFFFDLFILKKKLQLPELSVPSNSLVLRMQSNLVTFRINKECHVSNLRAYLCFRH